MRASIVSLILVALTGCLQPVAPLRPIKQARLGATQTLLASQSRLNLSVDVSPRVQATPGVWITTLSITNLGQESVVIGEGRSGFIHLAIDNFNGHRAYEFHLGILPITIGSKQTMTSTVELPANLGPGLYRFSMWIDGRPETSPPFIVRLLPRTSDGYSASPLAPRRGDQR